MAPPSTGLPQAIQSIIERINNIKVGPESQILSLDQLREHCRRFTEDLRPGTYLIGTEEEEAALAARGGSRQIDNVEFASLVSFGIEESDDEDEEEGDKEYYETDLIDAMDAQAEADDVHQDEDAIPSHHNPERHLLVEGNLYHVAEYLGRDWVDMIRETHLQQPIDVPAGMRLTPHPYQLKGAAQIDWCCEGPFRGCILADRMGMGKTLTSTLAMWLRKDEPGMSLVVAPASVCAQWVDDIHKYFDEEHGLRAFWLRNSRTSATWLLSQGFDIIVVSYEFVETSLRPLTTFRSEIESYVNQRQDEKRIPLPKRPTTAIFSPLLRAMQRPWIRVVLDEAQNASQRFGKRHIAIQHLPAVAKVCVSGTVAHNKWTAFSAYLDFFSGHPWTSHYLFMRTFCGNRASPDTPGLIETKLLQRMLSPIFIGRPLDNEFAAKLNGLDCTRLCFDLDDFDAKLVDTFVARYKEEIARLARKGQGSHDQRRRSDGASNAAMGWASKARCAAAHPLLLAVLPKPKKQKDAESKGDNSRKRISLKAYGTCDEDVDDQERPYWLKLIKEDRYLEQHSARIRVAVVAFKWFRHRYPEEKIGICSVSLKLLDILAEVLKRQFEIDAVRFDGLTTPVKRKLTLRKFDESPPAVPMLITAAAGAFGLNLVNISCLIQLEPWWNINNEQQFISRAYRLGQTKKVKYVRLDAQNSEIDVLTTQVQLKKKTVNDRLMAPLIRRHDAEPVISNLYI